MRNFGKCTRTVASLLAGVSVLALASQAMAQSDSKSESVEAVTVTGSRVITNGNDMPTPVTIVTPESLTEFLLAHGFKDVVEAPTRFHVVGRDHRDMRIEAVLA